MRLRLLTNREITNQHQTEIVEMTRTIEIQVFRFDELSDAAKENARNWWRRYVDEADFLFTIDDAKECAAIIGIDIDDIYYSGFSSQGDGASFVGSYQYKPGAAKSIRQHAPKDATLHRIADALQAAQRKNFYCITAHMSRGHLSNHYSHSGTMAVDVWHSRDSYRSVAEADDVTQAMRDFADWIYRQIESAYEFIMSDENVDESIRMNEYEFTAEGEIA